MSTVIVKRSPRADGPPMPSGRVELAEPPVLGEPATADFGSVLLYLPMGLGTTAMVLMFSTGGSSPTSYLMSGVMGIAMVSMTFGQLGRAGGERKRRIRAERRDYLRYLGQLRAQARAAAEEQRAAVCWDNPRPQQLAVIAAGPRLWERRPGHEDFARVRTGVGMRRAALEFVPPHTRPVEDLEPLSAVSLRRFARAGRAVPGIPVTVALRRFTSVELVGDRAGALGLARAVVGQLATFHSPDELRIALLTDDAGRAEWDWVKWLPHNAHPEREDATGPLRLTAGDHDGLMELLGAEFADRPGHEQSAVPGTTEPFVVIVADGVDLPERCRLLDGGVRCAVVLDVTGALRGGPKVLRLTVENGKITFPTGETTADAEADLLTAAGAERVARTLAPCRTSGTVDLLDKPLETDFDLTALLGIRDARGFDVASLWRPRTEQQARLVVPIGVTEDGEVVEVDLKESAQGGMGPHGLLIGATGSGKSELLRTLVVGLAATHSSDVLNLVLVDFKGGATFLNMDRLPHTSAVITNLSDELPLVDRMQDSLTGEVIRRQELLRESGYSSLFDYEKARLAGARLAPLPSLVIVVDEFSELLASKPDFAELFVMIGRVGRSLGIHLLLASQRLDEGRINRVEGHLSYRIALRTFSSMESRSVIGSSSAYELPSEPGHGYLKIDTTNLVRFKAAYVSGPCPEPPAAATPSARAARVASEVVPFRLEPAPASAPEPEPTHQEGPLSTALGADGEQESGPTGRGEGGESLLEVMVDRLVDAGPPARQVWLPPLDESPSLDHLLPGIVPDPVRGMAAGESARHGALRVPLGVVDRPYEQLRELLEAELFGADGHVAVAGAPQMGKSTLLRSLMLSLALTHTPAEVQFYCLDFGGGLASVSGLPHVGSVAGRLDRDRVLRTVEEISQLLEVRERQFADLSLENMAGYRRVRARGEIDSPYGDVFLVIDGWATLRQDFEDLETRIAELAARGLAFGVHVVISAVRWSEIRPRLRDLIGTRLELRLGDPMESEVGTRAAGDVPQQPGRGLTSAGYHFRAALPRLDGSAETAELATATRAAVAEVAAFWSGAAVPGVRLLPTHLAVERLPAPEDGPKVCVGWDEQRLQPVWHDFSHTPHLMVFGDGETGKSNALRLTARAITSHFGPERARILLADPGRELLKEVPEAYRVGYVVDTEALADLANSAAVSMQKRLPGPEITPERLHRRDWWEGPELFVLVDDYDLLATGGTVGGPLAPLVPYLAQGVHIGLHLVVSRSTSGAMRAMMDPLLRRMWELGSPALLLSYPNEEGKFLGEAKPRTLPPGRAQLVTRRGVKLVQTGLVRPR